MNNPFKTLLYDLFLEPVQWLWNRRTSRKVSRAEVQIGRSPAQTFGNVAWELEKASWRAPAPATTPNREDL